MTLPVVLGIAGCIALLAGLFGGGVKAKELEVPKLPKGPRILSIVGGLILVGSAVFVYLRNPSSPEHPLAPPSSAAASPSGVLTVQIWDVVDDQKDSLVASEQFSASDPETVLSQAGHWIVERISEHYGLSAPEVRMHVDIPADLATGQVNLQSAPTVPYQIYIVDTQGGSKVRLPAGNTTSPALGSMQGDFKLEISVVGYSDQTLPVTPGQRLQRDLILEPEPVALAFEDFSGADNSYATQIANYIATNQRFSIKQPDALKVLRDKIATEQAYMAANPMVQNSVRTSLGVDLIISGSLQTP